MTGKIKETLVGCSVIEDLDLKEGTLVGHADTHQNPPSDF